MALPDPIQQKRIADKLARGIIVRTAKGSLVCSTCGGNCGQCGMTDILDGEADMNILIASLNKGRPALEPKPKRRSLVARIIKRLFHGD